MSFERLSLRLSPITPDARSIAIAPTSERSEAYALWRSASICAWAVLRTRAASACAGLDELGSDALGILTSLVADARRRRTRLSELGVVLLERLLGTGLRLFGPLEAALDGVLAGVERSVDARQHLPDEEHQDDEEGERTPDQVGQLGDEQRGSLAAANAFSIRTPSMVVGLRYGRGERDERDTDRDEAESLGERDTDPHEGLKTTPAVRAGGRRTRSSCRR